MKNVKVYGPGCKRCEAVEKMVKSVATRIGAEVEIEKVTDAKSIALAGVISTPGLAVDGKLVHAGGLPDEARLEAWLGA